MANVQTKIFKRIEEICGEFDARVQQVGLEVARLELAKALAENEDSADKLTYSRDWHKERVDALQQWMMTIPEPFRSECSDVVANGKVAPWRVRLSRLPQSTARPGDDDE